MLARYLFNQRCMLSLRRKTTLRRDRSPSQSKTARWECSRSTSDSHAELDFEATFIIAPAHCCNASYDARLQYFSLLAFASRLLACLGAYFELEARVGGSCFKHVLSSSVAVSSNGILAEGAMTLPVTLSGGVLFAS